MRGLAELLARTAGLFRMPTGSGLQLVAACPASAVLDRHESSGEAAVQGSAIHKFLEDCPRVGREEALTAVPAEYRAICEAIDVGALPLDGARVAQEVTFAYDLVTGKARELGRSLERDYSSVTATEVVGTADAVGLSADGRTAIVYDWKTGYSELAKADRNWQMRFLSLAAARTYGATSARVALVHVPPDTGLPWYDSAAFDGFEIDLIAHELAKVVERVAKAGEEHAAGRNPRTVTGSHCRYCPALAYCPAKTAVIKTVVGELEEGGRSRPLTPARAADAWEKVKALEAIVKRAKADLYTFAASSPIPLANGMVLGYVETTREAVDGPTARAALIDLQAGAEAAAWLASGVQGGTDTTAALDALYSWDFAERACDFTTSKAAIERALRPVSAGLGLTFAAVKRAALDAVREAGAIAANTTTQIKEHVPDNRAAIEVANNIAALAAELKAEAAAAR